MTGEHRFEQGANRTGVIPGAYMVALALILLMGLATVWWGARMRSSEPAGGPALTAVAVLLLASPVLSPGYLAWLLPWGAIASDRKSWRLAFVPCLITGVLVAKWNFQFPQGQAWSQGLLMLRNLALLAIPAIWFLGSAHPNNEAWVRIRDGG